LKKREFIKVTTTISNAKISIVAKSLLIAIEGSGEKGVILGHNSVGRVLWGFSLLYREKECPGTGFQYN